LASDKVYLKDIVRINKDIESIKAKAKNNKGNNKNQINQFEVNENRKKSLESDKIDQRKRDFHKMNEINLRQAAEIEKQQKTIAYKYAQEREREHQQKLNYIE
jgi:hypothetical protein